MADMNRWGICVLLSWLAVGVVQADLEQGLDAVARRDWAAALAEFQPLAKHGQADAQVNLGNLYMKGWGVEQDYGQARHWYLKAAEQGQSTAQGKLGLVYYYGLGVEANPAEAIRWFRKAAEQGEPAAAMILGTLYTDGEGVAQDRVQAYFWYSVALERGRREAMDRRNELVDAMSPGEIDEALGRFMDWRRRHEPAAEAGTDKPAARPPTGKPRRGKP